MKAFLLMTLFLMTSLAQAMPYVCESHDNIGGKPLLRIKINAERLVTDKSGQSWRKFLLGVTPATGLRKILYASGNVTESSVGMTIVEDNFVIGFVKAYTKIDGGFEGDARISGFERGQTLAVTCLDEAPAPAE